MWQARFVKNLPRRGPVQRPDWDIGDDFWVVNIAEIYSRHIGAIRMLARSFIVRNAATGRASIEFESLVSPRVRLKSTIFGHDPDRLSLKVCPEGPVATTHRAIALRHFSRLSLQLQHNGTAVT